MRSTSTSNTGSSSSGSTAGRSMQATWLGETTALVQFIGDSVTARKSEQGIKSLKRPEDTINVLFNPSRRAQGVSSPLLSCGLFRKSKKLNAVTAGPARSLDDLPEIHYVLLSNTEAEQLDTATLLGLHKRDCTRFIVASGAAHQLVKIGIPAYQISELAPHKDEVFTHSSCRTLRVTSVPAIADKRASKQTKSPNVSHWIVQHENGLSEKTGGEEMNRSTVLFVASSNRKVADTSVNDLWKDVQTRYGPLDLAFIPLWAGKRAKPNFFKRIFLSASASQIQEDYAPVEAADVHQSLRSGLSIAMIHGLTPRIVSPFSDEDDDDDVSGSSSSTKSPQAVQAIMQLKSACDRTERRSVEFRRGQGSIMRKHKARRSGKSTFAVINEGQSISL